MAGDAGKIMEEVVKHMTTLLGADVQVTLEIEARTEAERIIAAAKAEVE